VKRGLVVIDTSVVVALHTATESHHDRVRRWLKSIDQPIALPAPALVELLAAKTSGDDADKLGRLLASSYQVLALDQMAAREAGLLAARSGGTATMVKAIKEAHPGVGREQVKTDLMILGCAVRAGGILFSLDGPLRSLAARLKLDEHVADIPQVAEQPALPGLKS
jgi:predicted nucleic acid-binding protein